MLINYQLMAKIEYLIKVMLQFKRVVAYLRWIIFNKFIDILHN